MHGEKDKLQKQCEQSCTESQQKIEDLLQNFTEMLQTADEDGDLQL